ncbi:TnpV protein, partial [Dysosmobacter welbionis]
RHRLADGTGPAGDHPSGPGPHGGGNAVLQQELCRLYGGQQPCQQRHRGICGGHPGGQGLQPGGAVLRQVRPSRELLPGLYPELVPLYLGLHESVPVHPAHHPAGDPPGGHLSLPD